ncbi:hypothetical protein [Arcanobacterium phocae]|uniref:Uncharacterized protein n=1 Tax=Arcanobacterium phocae TaxID=131112 RepID=A0A1H2LB94_9ACTO|nr:hypothetical protein [Arcanobacterium phocae]SDU77888.1 hypothetical protein SAMN04489737_0217 [Arcanobacterium phocae]
MSTSTSSTSFFTNRLTIFVTVFLIVVTAVGFGIWRWGQSLNYWGTPKALSALLAEDISRPTALGLAPTDFWQTPPAGFMGKSLPYEVRYTVGENADGETLAILQKAATDDGWVADSSCPESLLWCANKQDSYGPTKRLTISLPEDISPFGKNFPIIVSVTYY